jgi:hypothetical protein
MKIRAELAYVGEVMEIRSSIQELDACSSTRAAARDANIVRGAKTLLE